MEAYELFFESLVDLYGTDATDLARIANIMQTRLNLKNIKTNKDDFVNKIKIMNKNSNSDSISRDEVNEMIENALRRHNRRSTIISSVLGWILIGGYSFGLFQAVQNV